MKHDIIIESGSTKADFAIVDSDKVEIHKVAGINPTTLTTYKLPTELIPAIQSAKRVFFYGAGVSSDKSTATIRKWLNVPEQTSLLCHNDLLAACRAASGSSAGIVSIIGTGSNSCVYDGSKIIKKVPALGYILGDEGAGTHIGKEIIKAYYNNTLPLEIRNRVEDRQDMDTGTILTKIYKGDAPNKFMASFASILIELEHPWKNQLLSKTFSDFIDIRILPYAEKENLPLHFVGSIAHGYQIHLKSALEKHGLSITSIIKSPIDSLIKYHQQI